MADYKGMEFENPDNDEDYNDQLEANEILRQGQTQAEVHDYNPETEFPIFDPSVETRLQVLEEKMMNKYGRIRDSLDREILKIHIKYHNEAYYYVKGGRRIQLNYKVNKESIGAKKGDFKSRDALLKANKNLAKEFLANFEARIDDVKETPKGVEKSKTGMVRKKLDLGTSNLVQVTSDDIKNIGDSVIGKEDDIQIDDSVLNSKIKSIRENFKSIKQWFETRRGKIRKKIQYLREKVMI